jgi:hypothetical protein
MEDVSVQSIRMESFRSLSVYGHDCNASPSLGLSRQLLGSIAPPILTIANIQIKNVARGYEMPF